MKLLGAGLSRTGTFSLCQALRILGFNAIHWEPGRLRDIMNGTNNNPDFRRYDDVDAVTDLPAALFYNELCAAYPGCRLILTVRNEDEWYHSVKIHYEVRVPANMKDQPELLSEARATQMYVYGSDRVSEFLYKKKFLDHNQQVINAYPDSLVMDITAGDGWEPLCDYLGVSVPDVEFPCINVTPGFPRKN